MPEHTIKFNLPEESLELEIAIKASDYLFCLEDIAKKIRDKIKYSDSFETTWEKVEQMFYDTLKGRDIDLK